MVQPIPVPSVILNQFYQSY